MTKYKWLSNMFNFPIKESQLDVVVVSVDEIIIFLKLMAAIFHFECTKKIDWQIYSKNRYWGEFGTLSIVLLLGLASIL